MLTKKALSERIGVNSHTVTLWDKGETVPTPDNLNALSSALNYPVGFFYGCDLDEPSNASFRSQSKMPASVRDAALAAGCLGFMISDWVAEKFNLPDVNVPDLHLVGDPEAASRTLRQEWGLGEKPVSNMIQLLESKGVQIFSLEEQTASVNAYSLWRNGKPYVFLNTFKSAESSRFDAAHELAHLVLHQDGSVKGRSAEDQANAFASAFLMPSSDVLGIRRVSKVDHLVEAKKRWKVSVAALNYRIHKLGLISDWRYRDLCIEISKRGYNRDESSEIDRERSVIWDKVLKALWAEQFTHIELAEELKLPHEEVCGLMLGVLGARKPPPEVKEPMFQVVGT